MAGISELKTEFFNNTEWVTRLAYDELLEKFNVTAAELRERVKNKALSDAEVADYKTTNAQNITYKEEWDKIALFLREHYKKEIDLGQHKAFGNSLADVVVYYLGKERMANEPKTN
jgi:hypothetical protein